LGDVARNGISRLSRAEREQRGRIGQAKTSGGDVVGARLVFDELKSARELREAAERLVSARRAQGKSAHIDDVATLSRIAALIGDSLESDAPNKKIAAAGPPRRSGRSEQIEPARTRRSA